MSKSQLIKIANRNNEMLSAIIERPPVSTQGKMVLRAVRIYAQRDLSVIV